MPITWNGVNFNETPVVEGGPNYTTDAQKQFPSSAVARLLEIRTFISYPVFTAEGRFFGSHLGLVVGAVLRAVVVPPRPVVVVVAPVVVAPVVPAVMAMVVVPGEGCSRGPQDEETGQQAGGGDASHDSPSAGPVSRQEWLTTVHLP